MGSGSYQNLLATGQYAIDKVCALRVDAQGSCKENVPVSCVKTPWTLLLLLQHLLHYACDASGPCKLYSSLL